jgi:hypothetical protein
MTKRLLGVLAALSMVSGTVVACSSSSDTPPGGTPDTGVKPDAVVDSGKDTKPTVVPDGDTGGGGCVDKTTGLTCMSDDDCDKMACGVNICTEGAFGGDSLYPSNTCIGRECDPGAGTTIEGCDGDTGVCLPITGGGICLPVCEFKDSAAPPTGCIGKNACNVYGWGKAMDMSTIGIGYCFGGCKIDTDCPTGNKCQKEDGLCKKTLDVYTKTVGQACTDVDAKDPAKCNCQYTTAEKMGYCTQVCRFGESGVCGTGFSCDVGLPKTKLMDDDTVFTAVPAGMQGNCLKNCTTDADCAGLNAHCDENAGMAGQKTCNVGPRRCAKNEQCPTGQTCMGASATALGKCG